MSEEEMPIPPPIETKKINVKLQHMGEAKPPIYWEDQDMLDKDQELSDIARKYANETFDKGLWLNATQDEIESVIAFALSHDRQKRPDTTSAVLIKLAKKTFPKGARWYGDCRGITCCEKDKSTEGSKWFDTPLEAAQKALKK